MVALGVWALWAVEEEAMGLMPCINNGNSSLIVRLNVAASAATAENQLEVYDKTASYSMM